MMMITMIMMMTIPIIITYVDDKSKVKSFLPIITGLIPASVVEAPTLGLASVIKGPRNDIMPSLLADLPGVR